MKLTETPLAGAWIIDITPLEDHRGFFARTYCEDIFRENGLNTHWPQTSVSFNLKKGTLRGLHYQKSPHAEAKLVRCTTGKIYDVIVDVRKTSSTYGQWIAVELCAQKKNALYIPEGFAHGFQTLEDNTEILYYISKRYCAESATGICWDDPALAISWPLPEPVLSEKDNGYPPFLS